MRDWGSAVGFSWAQQYPGRVKGIAYMEAFVGPLLPDITTNLFARFRSQDGKQAVLEENLFMEQMLLGGLQNYLSEEDKAEYRRPYLEPGESRCLLRPRVFLDT